MEQLFEDCDIHSVKFLGRRSFSRPRRLIWLILFLAALGTFIWFSWMRISYFLSNPYTISTSTDTDNIPIPAIAICPSNLFNRLPENASDVDFLIELYNDKKAPFLLIDSDTGEASIDLVEMNKHISFSLEDTWSRTSLEVKDISRLQNITSLQQIRFPWKSSALSVLLRHGMKRRRISTWLMMRNMVLTSLIEHTREEMSARGLCLVLDHINGTDLSFYSPHTRAVNYMQVTGPVYPDDNWNLYRVIIHDKHVGGLFEADPRHIMQPVFPNQNVEITLNKVWHRTHLGKPYEEACVPGHRVSCVKSCLQERTNCSTFFLNVSHTGSQCDRWFLRGMGHEMRSCKVICPRSCVEQYIGGFPSLTPRPGSWRLVLKLENKIMTEFEKSVAKPLYTWDSLFAELGGTLGLFMGASVLALVHVFESFGRFCCHHLQNLKCLCRGCK